MKFSIIIPHCNEGYLLDIMFDAMYKQFKNVDFEVILVDDGSDHPEDLDWIATHELAPKTKVFMEKGLGAIGARNFGASHASGDWLVFFDAHMYFVDNVLEQMSKYIEQYPHVSVFQGEIHTFVNKHSIGHMIHLKNSIFETQYSYPSLTGPTRITGLAGAMTFMKKEVWAKIDGWHPFFQTWGLEDQEIAIRLFLHGYDTYVLPGVKCIHFFKGGGIETHSRRDTGYYSYNSIVFAYTCFSGENLHRILQALHKRYGKIHEENMESLRENIDFWNWLEVQKKKYQRTDTEYFDTFGEYLKDFWTTPEKSES